MVSIRKESHSTELEERLQEILKWLEIKDVKVTEMDKDYFERVLRLASNDGYKQAIKIGGN